MNKNRRLKSQLYYIALVILFALIFGYTAINIFDFGSTGRAFITTCSDTNTILKVANPTGGGHAGTWDGSSYTQELCDVRSSGQTCKNGNVFARLSGTTNAHVEKKGVITNNYFNVCFGDLTCSYASTCPSVPECLASISGDTNAHIGDCNVYSQNVCCKVSECVKQNKACCESARGQGTRYSTLDSSCYTGEQCWDSCITVPSVICPNGICLNCSFDNTAICTDGETPAANTGTAFADGKIAQGILIDSTDVLNYAALNNFNNEEGTIAFWFKTNWNANDPIASFVWFFDTNIVSTAAGQYRWSLSKIGSDLVFNVEGGTKNGLPVQLSAPTSISDWKANELHYITAAWDNNTGIDLYIDGALKKSNATKWDVNSGLNTYGYNLYLGIDYLSRYQVNGIIDELKVYNYARTKEQICQDSGKYWNGINCSVPNSPPSISAIQDQEGYENTPWILNLTSYVSDINNDPLTITTNSTYIRVNGKILTLNYSLPINESVKITVSDGLLSSSTNVNVKITAVNDPPILAPIGSLTAIIRQPFNKTITAVDEENNPLTFSANTALFSISNGTISFTPTAAQNGTYSINFSVSDGQLTDYEIVSFSIVETNRPPVISNFTPINTTINTTKGTMLFFNFSAYDPDGTTPSQKWLKDDTATLSTESSLLYNATSGMHTIKLVITDGIAEISQAWNISASYINNPPILIMPVPDQTITGNKTNVMNLNNYFTDPDDDTLTFSATTNANVNVIIVNGVVSFYSTTTTTTTERVIFTASDNIEAVPSNEISINIIAVAPSPKCGNNALDAGEECDGTKNQACKGLNCKSDCTCTKAVVPSCTPNWQCDIWLTCISGRQTRTCRDANSCNNMAGKPSEQQSCTVAPPQIEQPTKIKKPWWQGWMLYAILAVIVLGGAAGGGFVVYKQQGMKKKMATERQRLLQQEMMRAETQREAELRRYIADTLNKGFTQEQIKKRLIETGWSPAVVDRSIMAASPKKQMQSLLKLRPFEQVMQQKQEGRNEMFTQFEEKKEAEEIKPLPLKEKEIEKSKENEETFEKLGRLTKESSPFERLTKLKMKK
ncbi:MAG: LamG-like jellyroll fold domain-containing protein [Candidatus Woesearchaeota archaeon]|nr:LamG-like jellyroll fold domain-containing protein [Candidatus Woesearchaeota archaeon]